MASGWVDAFPKDNNSAGARATISFIGRLLHRFTVAPGKRSAQLVGFQSQFKRVKPFPLPLDTFGA